MNGEQLQDFLTDLSKTKIRLGNRDDVEVTKKFLVEWAQNTMLCANYITVNCSQKYAFYGIGCSFGLLASLIIIEFVLYRFAPKKLIGLPILVGGWSLAMYMLHLTWKNFASLAAQYQKYSVAYVVQEVSVGVITLLVLHQFTRSWLGSFLRGIGAVAGYFWKKLFPPRRRLLTREEYEKEGIETTKRELEKLQHYCPSPDADVWKITSARNIFHS
ncbi:unnamed protein product [Cylicocyclus nassatus]|uniref:Uncharacterized protein n=1 Tax=Cylicocyclus nassatus TaxID=53992 RepID=A0AA36M7A5_CYLNA|nr:unnamed protein product [Cylicocyclus nassatus]